MVTPVTTVVRKHLDRSGRWPEAKMMR